MYSYVQLCILNLKVKANIFNRHTVYLIENLKKTNMEYCCFHNQDF